MLASKLFPENADNEDNLRSCVIWTCEELAAGRLAWLSLITELGPSLTDASAEARRTQALQLISQVLERATADSTIEITQNEVQVFAQFFVDRLQDSVKMFPPAVAALECLARHPHASAETLALILRAFFGSRDLRVSHLAAPERRRVYTCLSGSVARVAKEGGAEFASEFLYGVLNAVEGETNPGCLDIIFHMWPKIIQGIPCDELTDDIFDLISCYFPIDFSPGKKFGGVTRDDLTAGLHAALASTSKFSRLAVPLFMEKLSSSLVEAKIDSLQCLLLCLQRYTPHDVGPHLKSVWNSCKQEIMGIRSNTNANVVKLAHDVLGLITSLLCQAVQSPENQQLREQWLCGLIWSDMKPFLRFLESGLMETAVRILARVTAADASAAEELLTRSIPVLVDICAKAEDQGRVFLMIATLLSSSPASLNGPDYSPSVLGLCTRTLETSPDIAERGAAIRTLVTAHKCLSYALLDDALKIQFPLVVSDPGYVPREERLLFAVHVCRHLDSEPVLLWASETSFDRDNTIDVAATLCIECPHEAGLFKVLFEKLLMACISNDEKLAVAALGAVRKVCENPGKKLEIVELVQGLRPIQRLYECGAVNPAVLSSAARAVVCGIYKDNCDPEMAQAHLDAFVSLTDGCAVMLASVLCSLPKGVVRQLNVEALLNAAKQSELHYKVCCSFLNKQHRSKSSLEKKLLSERSERHLHWLAKVLLMSGHPLGSECASEVVDMYSAGKLSLDQLLLVLTDDEDISTRTDHICLPFYKQKFFQFSAQKLLSRFKDEADHTALECLLKQAALVPNSAVEAVLGPHVPEIAKLLFRSTTAHAPMSPAASLFIGYLRSQNNSAAANVSTEFSEIVIPFLLKSACSTKTGMGDCITALNALEGSVSEKLPKHIKDEVVKVTAELLDHKKRLVRRAAAETRNAWILCGGQAR